MVPSTLPLAGIHKVLYTKPLSGDFLGDLSPNNTPE